MRRDCAYVSSHVSIVDSSSSKAAVQIHAQQMLCWNYNEALVKLVKVLFVELTSDRSQMHAMYSTELPNTNWIKMFYNLKTSNIHAWKKLKMFHVGLWFQNKFRHILYTAKHQWWRYAVKTVSMLSAVFITWPSCAWDASRPGQVSSS